MMLLLEEHLSRLQLETDVTSIALSCVDIQPLDSQQAELFPERMSATRSCSGLLDQLEARLGPGVLKQLSVCQDYRPERASLDTVSRAWCGIPDLPSRPFFLLENPEPLDIHEGRPCWHGPLDRLMPVERIEQGWWDGCDIRRDYCVAENPEGSRLWIYHDRVFRGWFLHGLFA
jgi:protein ImuB